VTVSVVVVSSWEVELVRRLELEGRIEEEVIRLELEGMTEEEVIRLELEGMTEEEVKLNSCREELDGMLVAGAARVVFS